MLCTKQHFDICEYIITFYFPRCLFKSILRFYQSFSRLHACQKRLCFHLFNFQRINSFLNFLHLLLNPPYSFRHAFLNSVVLHRNCTLWKKDGRDNNCNSLKTVFCLYKFPCLRCPDHRCKKSIRQQLFSINFVKQPFPC